jgi:hypothetical protein
MSYAQFGLIQATDFNNLVGTNPNTTANVLNTVWSTGGGLSGYGQTAVPTVSVGGTVAASDWANLVNKTANSASHQASTITAVTAPASGGTVTYISAIPTNLQTIYTSRANATSQSGTTANTVTTGSSWSNNAVWTQTVSFANGDAARYFFNAGGQLKITMAHSNVTAGINLEWNQLASNVGTVVQSAITSGTATIAGTSYNGITKIGGGGNSPTISASSGYYAMTTANANVFTQVSSTGPAGYTGSYVNIQIKSNGTQGSNGDAGSVITIYTTWQEASNVGLTVGSGSSVTVTAVPPEVTYIGNTWGAITLAGSVAVI